MQLPDTLLCLFTARIERRNGSHVIEVPDAELRDGALEAGAAYRVALLPAAGDGEAGAGTSREAPDRREPPVEEGEIYTVEIEGIGDQGDGIARVDRGYVVIVPDTEVGDEVDVEIEEITPNFAMARVVED